MSACTLLTALIAIVVLMSGVARADVISGSVLSVTTGNTVGAGTFDQIFPPPPDPVFNNDQNQDSTLYAFNEQQGVTLSSAVTVEVGGGITHTIAQGTLVNSQIVFFDPNQAQTIVGNVTFDSTVLGIITSSAGLTASDAAALGLTLPTLTYDVVSESGLEAGDSVTINGSNADEINWNTSASTPGDWVRVLTVGTPLPSAAWGGIVLLGAFGLTAARRRSSSPI
jgi:hypothetical protein